MCMPYDPPGFLVEINDHVTQFVRKATFDPSSLVVDASRDYRLHIQNWIKIYTVYNKPPRI